MKQIFKITMPLFLSLLFILSCTKPPDYPAEPVIEFNRISKNLVVADSPDSILVTIDYTDGDGNLGFENNENNVFFKDLRDNSEFIKFRVPFIPVQGANNGISGEISVILDFDSPICCITPQGDGNCDAPFLISRDTVIYEITIADRDGNLSNAVRTDPIILLCQD